MKTMMEAAPLPSAPDCDYVRGEIGLAPDEGDIAMLGEMAPDLIESDLGGGDSTELMRSLGCTGCGFIERCGIGTTLERRSLVEGCVEAPDWLKAIRGHRSDMDGQMLLEQIEEGTLTTNELLGGIESSMLPSIEAQDLDELQHIKINGDAQLPATHLRFLSDEGSLRGEAMVIDAREVVGFKKDQAPQNEATILLCKLINKTVEVDPTGKPLLLSPDGKMQKPLKGLDARVYEMRMGGKNRLYFTVTDRGDDPLRVVLLGSHGGDASTQHAFISSLRP